MTFYRIYPVGRDGRYSLPPIEQEFSSDADVVAFAASLGDVVARGCEIWDRARFVGHFEFGARRVPSTSR